MKAPIVIKQSPFLLLLRIVEAEIVIGLALFAASFLANYEDLYRQTPVNDFVRYDIFIVVTASVIQLLVTFFLFFWWHSEEYRVKEKEILYRRGVFFDTQYSVLLKKVTSVEYKRNLFEFLLGYGTVIVNLSPGEKPIRIRSVENAELYSNVIKEAVDHALERKTDSQTTHPSVLNLILEGEHSRLEFKQTFRWDVRKGSTNKDLEKAAMKTVAAFLNCEGGDLLIGVSDNGSLYGLEEDFKSLVRKDKDGFENHFNQAFKTMIGAEFRQYVTISFEKIEDTDICVVRVEKAPKPVYLRSSNGDEEFFIRTGNTTSPLKVSEVNSYISSHWESSQTAL